MDGEGVSERAERRVRVGLLSGLEAVGAMRREVRHTD